MTLIDAKILAGLTNRHARVLQLLAEGKVSAETVDHVSRVVRLIADDLRQGFHLQGRQR